MELLSHLMVWLSCGAQLGGVTCFTAAPGNFSPGLEVEHNSYQVTSREMRGNTFNKFALLWGEAQKKITYSYPRVAYSYHKVT